MSVPIVTPTTTVLVSTASAHTLQAFIELVYIKTANDVLVQHMASLEQSLSTTKSAMDTLTRIQNLHNLITVKSKGQFDPANFSNGTTVEKYTSAASAFFASPISVSVSYAALSAGFVTFQAQMRDIKTSLSAQIIALSATTPRLADGSEDSNSLLAKLRLVLKDIQTTNADGSQAGARAWITDSYNKTATAAVTSAGAIQQNITNAITAGQSLNTTQTEAVRNFLYLFEEYYKSASAVLQAISQIITKMADGIAR